MRIGDIYKGYKAIQFCHNEHWGVFLMENIDEEDTYGVLDYSIETDSIYDFMGNMGLKSAMIVFINRMPITLE